MLHPYGPLREVGMLTAMCKIHLTLSKSYHTLVLSLTHTHHQASRYYSMCLDIQCFWEIYSLLLLAIYIKMIDYYTPVLGVWERLELFWYRKCWNNDSPQRADPLQFLHSHTLNRFQCWSIPIHCPDTSTSSVLPVWQPDISFSRQYSVKIFHLHWIWSN